MNEIMINPAGADDGQEFLEVVGGSSEPLTSVWFIVIDGDAASSGVVDQAINLGTLSAAVGTNGLYLQRDAIGALEPAPAAGTAVVVSDFSPDIENGTNTYLLVTSFTGSVGGDLDTNNDGTLETTPWTTVIDAVSVNDGGGAGDFVYAAALGGTDVPASAVFIDALVRVPCNGAWAVADVSSPDANGPYTIVGATQATLVGATLTPGDYLVVSPALSIDDVTKAEGNAGFTAFTFTVSMSKASACDVKVSVQTADGTATLANTDYVKVSTTLTIPANAVSGQVTVFVKGDAVTESDETFFVNLVNPIGATIADGVGLGTILNDDKVSPCLSINNVSHAEGNAGKTAFVFKVALNNPIDKIVTVDFETQDGTATGGVDYQTTSGTLVFPAKSQLSQDIIVYANGDVDPDCEHPENDEVFLIKLFNANIDICEDKGIGTIVNDDCITPVLLSRFDAETLDDGIALHWQFGDASEVEASWVERAGDAAGPWTPIVAEPVIENDLITVVDRSVEVGVEYRYRLIVRLANGETVELDQITVTADLIKEFALSRVSPNPATGPARIDFAIPRESNVSLQIMDIQGRVVAVLVDGTMKAGRHQAVWNGETRSGRAYPGVYFVRYQTPQRAFTKRLILTR